MQISNCWYECFQQQNRSPIGSIIPTAYLGELAEERFTPVTVSLQVGYDSTQYDKINNIVPSQI